MLPSQKPALAVMYTCTTPHGRMCSSGGYGQLSIPPPLRTGGSKTSLSLCQPQCPMLSQEQETPLNERSAG